MEPLKLPSPTLQFLASHTVVRCLVLMKVDVDFWDTNAEDSLRECELRVDKLPLPPAPREFVKNVLKGFFQQTVTWFFDNYGNLGADILVDAHGNIDGRRMARQHFQKRYTVLKDKFFREDFRHFVRFLECLSWYHRECCNDFVSTILDLQKVNTSLEGPEYRIVDGDLQVVFRFVNRRSVPPEFNPLLEYINGYYILEISKEQNDVLVTYRVYKYHYDENLFRIHVDLLQPLQRLQLVKVVLVGQMKVRLVPEVFRFLNVLDPETRRNSLLCLNEEDFHDTATCLLESCLIPGYESLFMPMMKLVGLNLDTENYFDLFDTLVDNIDLTGFDRLLLQFWKLLPASKKSEFRNVLDNHDDDYHYDIKEAIKKLSQENRALFQVLFDNGFVRPPKKKRRRAV